MEKANAAVNKLMEEGRLEEVACIVVDEVHMIGDQRRLCIFENCASVLFCNFFTVNCSAFTEACTNMKCT